MWKDTAKKFNKITLVSAHADNFQASLDDQTSSAAALLKGKLSTRHSETTVSFLGVVLLPLAFIEAPWGVLQGPLRSLGSQTVSPLTPVNLLHKFYLPSLKQANQQCSLCCFPLCLAQLDIDWTEYRSFFIKKTKHNHWCPNNFLFCP